MPPRPASQPRWSCSDDPSSGFLGVRSFVYLGQHKIVQPDSASSWLVKAEFRYTFDCYDGGSPASRGLEIDRDQPPVLRSIRYRTRRSDLARIAEIGNDDARTFR